MESHITSACPVGWSSSGDKLLDTLNKSWPNIALKTGMTVAFHPCVLAKTLIQIGHEPLSPIQTRKWMGMGKPALKLPSVFTYMGYIRKRDGFFGLYRGCQHNLLSMGVAAIVSDQFAQRWPKGQYEDVDEEELDEEAKQQKALDEAIKQIMERFAIIAVTQPLHVATIRAMASFVGQETDYQNPICGLMAIYRENGFLGFWSGMVPRALGEALTVILSSALTYFAKKYLDKTLRPFASTISSFMASSLCYPFTVVSHCSLVSRSGLMAGYPPCMPFYSHWADTWRHLYREKQLSRGSSLLIRYYTGPQMLVGERVIDLRDVNKML